MRPMKSAPITAKYLISARPFTKVWTKACFSRISQLWTRAEKQEEPMVRRLPLICAVAGALVFPVTAFAAEGDNHHHQNDQNQHQENGQDQRHSEHQDHDQDHWRDHDQHHAHDHDNDHRQHARHWYHGRYWDYGVGPCWRRTPVGWIWICGY
jgi:hypothetical protein